METKIIKKLYVGEKYGKYRKNILETMRKFQKEPEQAEMPVQALQSPLMNMQAPRVAPQQMPTPEDPMAILEGLKGMLGGTGEPR